MSILGGVLYSEYAKDDSAEHAKRTKAAAAAAQGREAGGKEAAAPVVVAVHGGACGKPRSGAPVNRLCARPLPSGPRGGASSIVACAVASAVFCALAVSLTECESPAQVGRREGSRRAGRRGALEPAAAITVAWREGRLR